jgi:thiol-disulfide isomerase/thioredoxin
VTRRRTWALAALLVASLTGCGGRPRDGTPAGADSARAASPGAASGIADSAVVRPATADQLLSVVGAPGARVVLLNVWATWCTPCREEFPDLLRIEREFRPRGLRLVLVSGDFDSELPAVKQFLAAHGVEFLTYLKQGDDMHFINGLDARWSGALPATLLYDGAGHRLWFHEGKMTYDTLKTRIDQALAAPVGPTH